VLAHPECNGLPHETLAWACSGSAARQYNQIGPWVKCVDVTDELELARSSLKSLMQNLPMGPLDSPPYLEC